jgi:hypothetical protein
MPNHPTAPVFEAVVGSIPKNCDQLKAKFGIKTDKYKRGSSNKRKEKHHILQDKAMKGLISKYSGWCVFLNGGSGGEHDIANASQVAKNCNGGAEGLGPKTFGDLLKSAKDDLEKALEGKVHDGNTVSKAQAKRLAACLVAEAEEKTQKERKRKKRKPLNANSRVKPVKGCFPFGTLIWLSATSWIPVQNLLEGITVETTAGGHPVVRLEECLGAVVELSVAGTSVQLAPHHRVRLSNKAFVRSDMIRRGHVVDTAAGSMIVEAVTQLPAQRLYGVRLSHRDACRVGMVGLWVELLQSDIPVIGHARVGTFDGQRP